MLVDSALNAITTAHAFDLDTPKASTDQPAEQEPSHTIDTFSHEGRYRHEQNVFFVLNILNLSEICNISLTVTFYI